MLRGRKLGGILVEIGGGKAVVGIGINLTSAPAGAARLGLHRDDLLDRLRTELSAWTSAPNSRILDRWRELSVTLGRRVRVELPGHTFEGTAQDIAEDGALVVDGQPVGAGDVIHLRQRGPAARSRAAPRRSARG
jgi:BirA family biotin operon repressor/biotin-[acetyl-CoA-carboxylase] ligase